jgi:beta-N-acetylhexosaminidase
MVNHPYIEQATLTQQLGQMIISGFSGTHAEDAGVKSLRLRAERGEIGGVILFNYNIQGPKQLKALVAHIKSWQTPLPLIISIDQEGGAVQRLHPNEGFHGWPSPLEVSAMPTDAAAASMDGLAGELRDFGINFDYAPCVDLHDRRSPAIGAQGRSYGSDPTHVAHWAQMQVAALNAHGVGTAVKHFPGHGSAQGDTHRGFTDVTPYWDRLELMPFAALISSKQIDAVLTSHIVNRDLDPSGDPVTFSRPIVHDLLRIQLGFDGLVVTDDLGMGALVNDYGLPTIIQRAVASGHDLLIFGQNAAAAGRGQRGHLAIDDLLPLVVKAVQDGIEAKSIDPSEIRRSLDRIATFKANFII